MSGQTLPFRNVYWLLVFVKKYQNNKKLKKKYEDMHSIVNYRIFKAVRRA